MTHQLALLDAGHRIVNVASVPQRSPFRYPGGKTWLVPRIREWLASLPNKPTEFLEPFAGGAIVGLTVAFERLADHVTIVEMDENVAAVWRTILGDDAGWLAEEIVAFELSVDSVHSRLMEPADFVRERAFQTILRNRVNRGGIMAAGAGRVKNGENGKGLGSRWYPETLKRRILAIAQVADRITFVQKDGIEVLRGHVCREDVVSFIDPPYTASGKRAGARLYTHNRLNHEELFDVCSTLAGPFMMTYDNATAVRDLAQRCGFATRVIPMKSTHHAEMTELLIGRSLEWVGSGIQPWP